jgi:hypothetical protein
VVCGASGLIDTIYFLSDTTKLNVPACVITPSICAIDPTFTSIGDIAPPSGFATLTKNLDNNSFTIALFSSNPLITGQSYQFQFTQATIEGIQ